jgi:cytochrome c-type biogenesis protein
VIELGTGVGILIAFIGGLVSFASPCCLPLVPAYLGYMAGATGGDAPDRRRALAHGLAFCTGFTVVFVAFWASIGAIGYLLADNAAYLRQAGGILIIVLGLQVAGVINIRALWRDVRPMPAPSFGGGATAFATGTTIGGTTIAASSGATVAATRPGYTRSLLFGTFFAAGWSPCIGPILGGIIGLASATESVVQGTVLLVAYAAGLAIPFLAVALGASWVSNRMAWVGRHHRAVSVATGVMLIAIGVLMVTNMLGRLAAIPSPFGL